MTFKYLEPFDRLYSIGKIKTFNVRALFVETNKI